MGTLDDTRRQISRELRYQSSTDLEAITYDAIRHLPMAKELSKLCRQTLTARLDTYALSHSDIFKATIQIIDQRVLPILKRSGMAGEAHFITRDGFFTTTPLAVDVLTDVLSDRGYHVTYAPRVVQLPVKVDIQTGEITYKKQITHFFKIRFMVSSVRDWSNVPMTGGGSGGHIEATDIASSYMPKGTDHQEKYSGKRSRERLVAQSLALDLDYQQEGLADVQTHGSDEEVTGVSDLDESDLMKASDVFIHQLETENEMKTKK